MMKSLLFILLLLSSFSADARSSFLEQLGLSRSEPLAVDKAFIFSADLVDAKTVQLSWQIAEGHYLYRDNFKFDVLAPDDISIIGTHFPEGVNKHDEYFGLTTVYPFDVQVELNLARSDLLQTLQLNVTYQGCSETFNICYPPETKNVSLLLPAITDAFELNTTSPTNPVINTPSLNEQDRIAQTLAEDHLLKILLGFFGLGLLLSFTPCVFPMVPILSSIIVGQGQNVSTRRAFLLSLTFVLAMSVTYTLAGVLTGLLGGNLQALLQNIWVISVFSGLLVILALSMFGFFHIQLPNSLQSRLHNLSHRQQSGQYWGVGMMGLLSGLIIGPCLAPPLAGALLFISQQADPLLGGAALFSMSLGMGLPLLIVGTSAGTLLPKAGHWMHNIRAFFGVLLLALAIWMLDRVLPSAITLFLAGSLLVISAIYMGALTTLSATAAGWQKFWKGSGFILLIIGVMYILSAASGGQSYLQPLKHLIVPPQSFTESPKLDFAKVDSYADLQQQLAQTTQPVMLDFYADWCIDCKNMEQTTFKDPQVTQLLDNIRLLKVDMTDNTPEHQALLRELQVFGPPSFVFYDANGREQTDKRLVGHVSASRMQAHLLSFLNETAN